MADPIVLPDVVTTASAPSQSSSVKAPSPFATRALTVTFKLGTGPFGDTGSNTLILKGLRVEFHSELGVLPSPPAANVRIYGMTLSHMNDLSRAGLFWQGRNNQITVDAGDNQSGAFTTIYSGQIFEAFPDIAEPPTTPFNIMAIGTISAQLKPIPPTSFSGPVAATTALSQVAKGAGLALENHGVSGILASPYFPGTAMAQIGAAVEAANASAAVDTIAGVLRVWPATKAAISATGTEALIAPETGMIGYPRFSQNKIRVRTLFNPAIKGAGTLIRVKSQLTAASGIFRIIKIDYNLTSQMPDGPWEMTIEAVPPGKS